MSVRRFFAFVVPDYFWMVLTPLIVVITGILQSTLSWINHKATDAKVDVVVQHTDGMMTKLQEQVDRQQVDKEHLAQITEKDKEIAIAKTHDKESL